MNKATHFVIRRVARVSEEFKLVLVCNFVERHLHTQFISIRRTQLDYEIRFLIHSKPEIRVLVEVSKLFRILISTS